MRKESQFNKALLISVLTHIIILFPLSALYIIPAVKEARELEVTYLKNLSRDALIKNKDKEIDLDEIGLTKRIILYNENTIPKRELQQEQKLGPDFLEKNKGSFQKPILAKTQLVTKNDIRLALSQSPHSKNPVYLNYQNFLRENLRRFLYNKYSDIAEKGEVYMTFVLKSDGTIKEAKIIEERCNSSARLKKLVIDSLYETAPFPPLPETLNTPLLSFSVTVHFKERNTS